MTPLDRLLLRLAAVAVIVSFLVVLASGPWVRP